MSARITMNKLPAIAAAVPALIGVVVEKTANDAVDIAMSRSRVDTGAMVNAWDSEVKGMRATVFNSQEHAIYNEYGTVRMSAAPMLRPAMAQVTQEFILAMRKVVPGAAGGISIARIGRK